MRRTLAAPSLALVLVLAGCTGTPDDADTANPSRSASSSTTAAPAAAPAAPEPGTCHALGFDDATSAVAGGDQDVPCREEHTSVTVGVEQLDLVSDGHLLAVESDQARLRLQRRCAPRLAWAGGDETARRLSRLEVVWFAPSADAVAAGADWLRCDLVAVRRDGQLLPLPGRARGLLDRPTALDRFGTCGTAAPAARAFQRVACAERHRWRAVDTYDLPRGTRFLGAAATDAADSACQDVASDRSGGSLELTWAFEWPTREQWDDGQRWGWCWVPSTA